jgi:[FeFe] hydrogenase H-cluster maturation GTPase HydF
MAFNDTIRGDRLHIAFFGRRNAGKSTLINALTGQNVAIISDVPGTTTDPVYKAMELSPVGPVMLIDTAGMDDDAGQIGRERVMRTREVLRKTDLAILVADPTVDDCSAEDEILSECSSLSIPVLIAVNKSDLIMTEAVQDWLAGKEHYFLSGLNGDGVAAFKEVIRQKAPKEWEPPFLSDLVRPGDLVLLVAPMDLGAPKGRLIMPQIKALRDCLDADVASVMCKERELPYTLSSLARKPSLVVTDSQVFPSVAADIHEDIPLTSFSILSARQKGDLLPMVESVYAVNNLKPGDRILIAEACSHHPLADDIARVKIPRWLESHVGGKLHIDTVPGSKYPDNLDEYRLVIHCGGCTLNRREMLRRQSLPAAKNIPLTNFGVIIAFMKNVFPRALSPFPEIYRMFSQN